METIKRLKRSGLLGFKKLVDRRWVKKKDVWGTGQVHDSLDLQFGKSPRVSYYSFHPPGHFKTIIKHNA